MFHYKCHFQLHKIQKNSLARNFLIKITFTKLFLLASHALSKVKKFKSIMTNLSFKIYIEQVVKDFDAL